MSKRGVDSVLVEQVAEAFSVRLTKLLADRRASGRAVRDVRDPVAVGEDAADFTASRLAVGRSVLAERIGPVYRTEDLTRWLTAPDDGGFAGETVRRRARGRRLVAFRTDDSHWAFPAWQFDTVAGRLVPRQPVIELWQDLPHDSFLADVDLAAWMRTRLAGLVGTPVDHVLSHGRTPQLTDAVRRLALRSVA